MESVDEILEILTSERRRFVLYCLDESHGSIQIDELAEQITEHEGEDSKASADDQLEEIIIQLEHTHLPKIQESVQVTLNRDGDQVQLTGLSPEADILLSVTKAIEHLSRSRNIPYG